MMKWFAFILICFSCYIYMYTLDRSLGHTRVSKRETKLHNRIVCLTSLGTIVYLVMTI